MFALKADRKTCESLSQDTMLIYNTKDKVKQIKFQGPQGYYHQLVHEANIPVGVSFDGEYYYWTEVALGKEQIVKTSITSTKKEVIVSTGLELPEDIEVDWLTKNIYFTDSRKKHIAVCTNDGAHCTAIVTRDGDSKLRSLALHPFESLMFWSDWGRKAHIAVAFMDGKQSRVLISDLIWPNGITLDLPNGRMYWVDAKIKKLETATIAGKDRRVLDDLVHPFSIAVYGNRLYWSDQVVKAIKYCDKFTGKNQNILEQGSLYYGNLKFK
jgi:Low-density lipoprotein receptor repeat class B